MKERKFINENIKRLLVTEYIKRETDSAGFGGIEMKRNLLDTSIRLVVNKPGLVIGRRGSKVQEIEETLRRKYKIEGPRIEVMEVRDPDLNPLLCLPAMPFISSPFRQLHGIWFSQSSCIQLSVPHLHPAPQCILADVRDM